MKFRIATLLSFLSGIAFFSAPAVSMSDDDAATTPGTIKRKPELTKAEQDALESRLGFSETVNIFTSLRPVNGVPDEDLIQYIVTESLGYKREWTGLTSPEKEWFFSSVESRALQNAVANPDATLITYSAIRKSGNTASAEDLISYLMGKETTWKALQPPQKKWFIAKATLADRLAAIKTSPAAAASPSSIPTPPLAPTPPPVPEDATRGGPPAPPPPPAPDISSRSQPTTGGFLAGLGTVKLRKASASTTASEADTSTSPGGRGRAPTAPPLPASTKGAGMGSFAEQAAAAKSTLKRRDAPPPSSPSAAVTPKEPQRMVTLKSRGSSPTTSPARSPSTAAPSEEPQRMVALKKGPTTPKKDDPAQ